MRCQSLDARLNGLEHMHVKKNRLVSGCVVFANAIATTFHWQIAPTYFHRSMIGLYNEIDLTMANLDTVVYQGVSVARLDKSEECPLTSWVLKAETLSAQFLHLGLQSVPSQRNQVGLAAFGEGSGHAQYSWGWHSHHRWQCTNWLLHQTVETSHWSQ